MAHHMEIGSGDDLLSVPLLDETPSEDQATQQEGHEEMVHVIQIESCIFRIHDGLRKSNPDAYTPMLISIGPYHRGKGKLKAMEVHKKRYLRSFVARGEHSEESYKETLKGLKTQARAYYADPVGLNNDDFVDMLLVDGSFIVEFVRKSMEVGPKAIDETSFINVDWMLHQVYRDLLLFENQLPFFVISKLYDMTKDPNTTYSFRKMVEVTFARVLPKLCPMPISIEQDDSREIKHLLHVVHIFCQPSPDKGRSDGNIINVKHYDGNNINSSEEIRSVTELQEAGVRFKKPETVSVDNLFNIEFDNGELKIPSFNIGYLTESLFRNFIAYEQLSFNVDPKSFSDYASFMDQLINSGRDVTVLRLEGIVTNRLGHDEAVAQVFNKLCHGVDPSPSYHVCYSELCKKVNEHCNNPYKVLMAKLKQDYFSSPWAGISTAAAIVLLLLTIAQTVGTFLAFQ